MAVIGDDLNLSDDEHKNLEGDVEEVNVRVPYSMKCDGDLGWSDSDEESDSVDDLDEDLEISEGFFLA